MVAAGGGHSLFLTDAGIVLACGDGGYGQLGLDLKNNGPSLAPNVAVPVPVCYRDNNSVKPLICAIACGDAHSLAIDLNGVCYSWGKNDEGQTGHHIVKRVDKARGELMPMVTVATAVSQLSSYRVLGIHAATGISVFETVQRKPSAAAALVEDADLNEPSGEPSRSRVLWVAGSVTPFNVPGDASMSDGEVRFLPSCMQQTGSVLHGGFAEVM